MTEQEWLACADQWEMLNFIDPPTEPAKPTLFAPGCVRPCKRLASRRKAAMYALACCRRHPDGTKNKLNRKALLAVERHAEGLMTDDQLNVARRKTSGRLGWAVASSAVVSNFSPAIAAQLGMGLSYENDAEKTAQSTLVRDIFGNPFHPISLDPTWLSPTVKNLAETIYDQRAFEKMPILGDALEDVGCTNADILDHCRSGQGHVQGCWVVDLVLGKE